MNLEVDQKEGSTYKFMPPISNRDWCKVESSIPSGNIKFEKTGPDLFKIDTQKAGDFELKFISYFPNNIFHESATVRFNIVCNTEECKDIEDDGYEDDVVEESDSQ